MWRKQHEKKQQLRRDRKTNDMDLLPITSAADLGSVPPELVGAFSLIFYSSPQEAVFKALGVE